MSKTPVTADDLYRLVFLGDPQIQPHGDLIAFSRKTITKKHAYETHIWTVSIATGELRQRTQGEGKDGGGRWSPDGRCLAFISGRSKPKPQIFLLPFDGGEAYAVTDLPEGSIGGYSWSPDGSMIAFSFRETAEPFTKAAADRRKEEGGATPPHEIDSEWYRLDGDGYFDNQRHRLYIADVKAKTSRMVYDGAAMGEFAFSWSPDSKELAITHGVGEHPLRELPNSQIYRVKLDGSAAMVPDQPMGGKSEAMYSPDGSKLAYIGNIDPDDPWGVRNDRIYVTSIDGGAPRCLTLGDDIDVGGGATLGDVKVGAGETALHWSADGQSILTERAWHGEEQLVRVSLDGSWKQVTHGEHLLEFGNLSSDGSKIAAVLHTLTTPGELVLVDVASGAVEPLTHENDAFLAEKIIQPSVPAWVESTDGTKVHVWMMKPVNFKEGVKHPAVLEIHGGPHAQYGCSFFHEFQVLAAQGYVVAFSNPRGSKGYGEKHCAAIFRSWGGKDWDDVQAVTSWLADQPFVDEDRLGVMGGSYGGYMTNWAIGHSKQYRAAITDRCVSNLVSMSGSSDFPLNPNGYFGGVAYGNLSDIEELWRQSPIAYFKGVTTPTLVIHSEGDLRCNIEQGEQVFYALQMQGIESRFVRYPVETSHGLSRGGPPDLRLHRLNEIVRWWSRHLA